MLSDSGLSYDYCCREGEREKTCEDNGKDEQHCCREGEREKTCEDNRKDEQQKLRKLERKNQATLISSYSCPRNGGCTSKGDKNVSRTVNASKMEQKGKQKQADTKPTSAQMDSILRSSVSVDTTIAHTILQAGERYEHGKSHA